MKICAIIGPTSVGKTKIAVEIARLRDAEIISADSRQIYRKFDIGTAKPTLEEQRRIKFHLIDILDPSETYSCGQFARDAEKTIMAVIARKKIPIICGGTGLYVKALFEPLHQLPDGNDVRRARSRLMQDLRRRGLSEMYERLRRIDPEWASKVNPADKQRIIRGLEIYESTGKTLTSFLRQKKRTTLFLPYYIGLTLERPRLYQRIDERFDRMIEKGLVREVENLIAAGLTPDNSVMHTIGYKEIYDHLTGDLGLDEAIVQAKRRTRNFARRQLTWFKKISDVKWFNADELPSARVQSFLPDLSLLGY